MNSPISLLAAEPSAAEVIIRDLAVPAHLNGPLFRTMFPTHDIMTCAERDEMTQWYVDMLQEAREDSKDASFLQACQTSNRDTEGTTFPVGFRGWETNHQARPCAAGTRSGGRTKQQQPDSSPENEPVKRQRGWVPDTIDVDALMSPSTELRAKRPRVLKDLDNTCYMTFMFVHPSFQGKGIGSAMLQRICAEIDTWPGCCVYVLAAPEGVRLYSKFDFKVVGQVETPQGNIISMFRAARL